jgi:DNA modification methylase
MPERFDINADHLTVPEYLATEFRTLCGTPLAVDDGLLDAIAVAAKNLSVSKLKPAPERAAGLVAAANEKLKLHQDRYRELIDGAATFRRYFNYHEKLAIQRLLDKGNVTAFAEWVNSKKDLTPEVRAFLLREFRPLHSSETFAAVRTLAATDPQADAVLRSIFRAYVFACFPIEAMHRHLSNDAAARYEPRFYDYLMSHYPEGFRRDCGLIYLVVDDAMVRTAGGVDRISDYLLTAVSACHERLSNHCFLAVLIRPLSGGEDSLQWKLYAELVLFAEKYQEVPLKKGYFHPTKIASETTRHIRGLDPHVCRFDLANEGMYFKDCFCISYNHAPRAAGLIDLLVLLEKNVRDETPIPCPACRSLQVQGNSYPVLGVRSWECHNALCPERSKYDRGNRYSFVSLLRQEAIEQDDAAIPLPSLRRWKRDIVTLSCDADIIDMLVRHYTLLHDSVDLVNTRAPAAVLHTRKLYDQRFQLPPARPGIAEQFARSAYFKRIGIDCDFATSPQSRPQNLSTHEGLALYCGRAQDVLASIESDSVDGAVTSPPYYNARDYATWSNIYCYLHDMAAVAREVYRVLKPGAPFLWNVFDYFDNERNIVFSLMGKKRMILGPYCIHLFQRLGFTVQGNVIWDKGEIEGKRNFNQGNTSPYYQAPFNCWEHIIVFSKGTMTCAPFPPYLDAKPVIKMVKGENVLGHSAPFPEAIPNMLLDRIPPAGVVLDPFSGSMTTGRVAFRRGVRSINIDYMPEYCNLGLRLLRSESGAGTSLLFPVQGQ